MNITQRVYGFLRGLLNELLTTPVEDTGKGICMGV